MKKEKINETIQNIKYAWNFAKKEKKQLALYSVTLILISALSIIVPIYYAQQLIYLTSGVLDQLLYLAFIIFGLELFRNVVHYFSNLFVAHFFQRTLLELQCAVAEETIKLETSEIDNNNTGVFIDRLKKDTNDIADLFLSVADTISNTLTNLGVLIVIFFLNKYIFMFFVFAMSITFIVERERMTKYFKHDKERRMLGEKNTSMLSELIRGIRDIKVLNADHNFMKKTREKLVETNNKSFEMQKINRDYRLLGGSVSDLLDLSYIMIIIYLISTQQLLVPTAIIISQYKGRAQNLLNYVIKITEFLKNFNLSATRVFEVIHHSKFKQETFGTQKLKKVRGNIEFRNVTFAYNDKKPVINDMSFQIKANETIAFVGKSGAGKSTIFSLISRLYKTEDNHIFIEGVDINQLDKNTIRDNLSMITQSPYIFNFSIQDNLKIVNEKVTNKEIIDACKMANLHDFVMSLPDGYDTIVGEGGVTLSGGQRQRLAIARALIKKSEIILFDEATSALDNETQREIQRAIASMKHTYTILIIAHRLSTVKDCDRIFVIDDGKVVGEGTQEELLKTNELFRDLYETELV